MTNQGNTTDRSGFQKMLNDAEAGRFQNIVVYKFDRFTRNAREMLEVTRNLERHDVALASILSE